MIFPLLQEFQSPSNIYRGQPFWAWNGKLEPEELRRQVRLMRQMGLGGFFMHSRVGLDTPYLSEEWFACIQACVEEAQKLGMSAWLYDEDRWPSGAAGGLVTREERFRRRSLVLQELDQAGSLHWDRGLLAAFTARVEGGEARQVRRIRRGQSPTLQTGETILAFRVVMDPPSETFNGFTYLDILNHKAVQRFIEITHEAYRERFSQYFGSVIPGIFCDEPGPSARVVFDPNHQAYAVPWTGRLPAIFRQRYGYDLLPHLPEIFFDVEGRPITPARRDFHDCVTFLFVDAFSRQISEWCERNNLIHIGHVLLEESLSVQTYVTGSCMRFYEHLQAPSIDLLTEHWRPHTNGKQVSSVARQFGRAWRLTETYGCTGWDFPFAGHKALGDWQVAVGLNLRCQHLAWYTMEGEAKRDYPAGIFYQSPWWQSYPKVEDYFARLHAALSSGTEVRDLLVVHPVESMWVLVRKGWFSGLDEAAHEPRVRAFDTALKDLEDTLFGAHLDFDYGDEDILARHASVVSTGGAPRLRVGLAEYAAVVVPPMLTVRRSTLDLLRAFRQAGGAVIFAGDPPAHVDASPSGAARELSALCGSTPASGDSLARAVEPFARRVSITLPGGHEAVPVLYLLREDEDAFYLFLSNTGDSDPAAHSDPLNQPGLRERALSLPEVTVRGFAACEGRPLELDPDTGAIYTAAASRSPGQDWAVHTSFPPLGSRLFVFPKAPLEHAYPLRPVLSEMRRRLLDLPAWPILRSEPNCLPLDRPRYRAGEGGWNPPEEILRVDRAVRASMHLAPRGGAMVQPWARPKKDPADLRRTPVELVYSFEVESLPSGELFLAIEQPARFSIYLNDSPVSTDVECGWWVDHSLRKVPVPSHLLRKGCNELRLALQYDEYYTGLEVAYLLGNFGVRAAPGLLPAVTAEPRELRLGDWVEQGLPFYSGALSYCAAFEPDLAQDERLFLQVPAYWGAAVRVTLNGRPAGVIAWEPNELELTGCLQPGENDLRIEVLAHRRNSHGPLHNADRFPFSVGPESFMTQAAQWTDDYQLVPLGLAEPPCLVVRREEKRVVSAERG